MLLNSCIGTVTPLRPTVWMAGAEPAIDRRDTALPANEALQARRAARRRPRGERSTEWSESSTVPPNPAARSRPRRSPSPSASEVNTVPPDPSTRCRPRGRPNPSASEVNTVPPDPAVRRRPRGKRSAERSEGNTAPPNPAVRCRPRGNVAPNGRRAAPRRRIRREHRTIREQPGTALDPAKADLPAPPTLSHRRPPTSTHP